MVYADDIVIFSKNMEEHIQHVTEVLQLLNSNHLRVNVNKCQLALPKLVLLGFTIDANGIHCSEQKFQAIMNMAIPQNTKQLQSLLGLLTIFGNLCRVLLISVDH